MRILGCDIGKTGGIAVFDSEGGFLETCVFNFTSLVETYEKIKFLVKHYKIDAIVTGKPNMMYNIIMKHMPYVGVINLVAEENRIYIFIVNDGTMRKEVLGKGKGMRKDLVHEEFRGATPDVSDAMMMCVWGSLNLEQ